MFLNIVLDDAVEEKDGGEKVRLGMVVSLHLKSRDARGLANIGSGHSWKLSRYARGTGENRRWTREQRRMSADVTNRFKMNADGLLSVPGVA